ncbi:hypothetical protein HDU96_002592, partial [Phlyctochytrium bullatum]
MGRTAVPRAPTTRTTDATTDRPAIVKNFSTKEDVWIARAYKEITTDPAVGTDQTSEVFFQKIADVFNDTIRNTPDFVQFRSANSIRNRWQNALQPTFTKFTSCMAKALDKEQSGWNLADYMASAGDMYVELMGKSFKSGPAWE